MIIWLASYPRSGNTMLRMILRQSFGVETYSIYDDKTDIAKSSTVSALVGHRSMGMKARDFVRESKESSDVRFLKTHSPPLDGSPAIYVVRDGRAAVVSYFRYLKDVRDRADVAMRDVIEGRNVYFSSWSGSLREWNPLVRPKTLLLRYEDLVDDAETAITQIGEFTGLSPVSAWENEFERMRTLYPEFFRAGSNQKNIAALRGDELEMFWALHGEMMDSMRYGDRTRR
jgi:hypothetical protein